MEWRDGVERWRGEMGEERWERRDGRGEMERRRRVKHTEH